jgi:membrane protein required for colicin V production
VTAFDYGAGLLLLASGLIGLARGATREITTVVALLLGAILAIFSLRVTGPMARQMIHTAWLANTAALLVMFVLCYLSLRLMGGALTRGVQETGLSGLDRLLGLGIGLVRAVVLMGAFALLLDAATPPERMPMWITTARLYPLAAAAGGALRAFGPEGMKVARDVAPALADAVTGDDEPAPGAARRRRGGGDSAAQDPMLDQTVEQSR